MKIGEFKGYPVYKVKSGFEPEIPDAIHVLPSGSMYLNGEVVGVLDTRTNRVVSWWPEKITKVKEEKKKEETEWREAKVMVSVEKKGEDEYHTFDLDGFLKEMEQKLEGERDI